MDFIRDKLYYWAVGQRTHFLTRHELLVPPLGWFSEAMGGVPMDRRHKGNTVEQVIARFRAKDDFAMVITPEGSRKARDRWKAGPYHTVKEAGVLIQLAAIDCKRKKLGTFGQFVPIGDLDRDIYYIRNEYRADQVKKPEFFNE